MPHLVITNTVSLHIEAFLRISVGTIGCIVFHFSCLLAVCSTHWHILSVVFWLDSSFIFCDSLLFPMFEGNTLVNEFWELCLQTVSIFVQVVGNFIDCCLRSFSEIQGKWLHLFVLSLATKEHPCWLTSFSRCFCRCLIFSTILVKIPASYFCKHWQTTFFI